MTWNWWSFLRGLLEGMAGGFIVAYIWSRWARRRMIYVGRGRWERQQNRIVELLGQNFKLQAENDVLRGFVTGNGHVRQIDERNDPEAAS